MKSNKEKVYDFIQMHSLAEKEGGVSTSYIAEALSLQRTNVSSILNTLVNEGRIAKTNGRPVLYFIDQDIHRKEEDCFQEMTGWNGSLKHGIQLAKAAILYPGRSLNLLIVGEKGTGKKQFAKVIYNYCIAKKLISEDAPFLQMNCRDYASEQDQAKELLMGKGEPGLLNQSEKGILYLDNIQYLGGVLQREVAMYSSSSTTRGVLIASCTPETIPAQEEFQGEFPIVVNMPKITERPIAERMEMIKILFSTEASRVGRVLVVKEELMRCLLLYECSDNFQQLKRDIKIGCANAYVRELANSDEITLFVSDFDVRIRQGILRYGNVREEIEKLIPENSSFAFDGRDMKVSETESKNIYKELSRKAQKLDAEGISKEDIQMLLSTELERAFGKYQRQLVHDITSKKELGLIVDEELIELVENFIKKVEVLQNRKIDETIFFGLCLHIKGVVNHSREPETVGKLEISQVVTRHKQEYMLSSEFAEEIQEKYRVEMPIDEVILITMFLCYEPPKQPSVGKSVILYAFYGKGIASSIVKTITDITGFDHVYSFELSYKKDENGTYEALKKCIREIDQGKGVCIVYDSDLVSKMTEEIARETGILIRLFPAPVTTMGIELARKALRSSNLDAVYRETMRSVGDFAISREKYLVTLCTTGKGGAEELKKYIEKYGNVKDVEVIPMSMSDEDALKEAFQGLMRQGTIVCVVGTFDPKLYSIPFCSITDVFTTPKERLPELLRTAESKDCEIDYQEVFDYLGQQFKYAGIAKLRPLLEDLLHQIDGQLKHITQDAQMGLLIHTACCVERLLAGEASQTNPKRQMICIKYAKEFHKLLRMLKPIEKAFRIIFSDDEVANMLMIIYQI
ncbi:MAG: PRD domain-containing protein [Lachnospiraceae bacterium]|nr:PRD domain-containing protein [Lachnospiraceae bacterium]